jgi:type II secretory pathway component PulK
MKKAHPDRRRRGSVLVAALVCLAIIVAMVGSMLVAALAASRQLRAERDLRQCELLLEAGADRAAYRLATERIYRGETWTLPAEKLAGSGEGRVTIELSPNPDQNTQQFHIVAEYPAGSETSVRRSRTISIPSKKSRAEE